jgi:hypothetical protein
VARTSALVVLLICSMFVTACAGGADNAGPKTASEAFYRSMQAGDFGAACALLLPSTRDKLERSEKVACVDALAALNISATNVAEVHAYGRKSMVEFDSDTVFLVQGSHGWLVTAAGCEERAGKPYDCELEAN